VDAGKRLEQKIRKAKNTLFAKQKSVFIHDFFRLSRG